MSRLSGREKEARLIRKANRAAAVGRLMLGEFNTWQEFLAADALDLESLPRRQLKSGKFDVRKNLSPEIKKFCSRNFQRMTDSKLSLLYEDIKAFRGLEIPLKEFEEKYARVNPKVLKGSPVHLTIIISLWGLKFKFPEDELAKDLSSALKLATEAHEEMRKYKRKSHQALVTDSSLISSLIRQENFASRSALLCCFNLMEAYLNGLAWDYVQTHDPTTYSNKTKKLFTEEMRFTAFKDKLLKFPQKIADEELWQKPDRDFDDFIDLKIVRDCLVHPSPFSARAEFGGYDKLRKFYRIDYDIALTATNLLIKLLKRIHFHVNSPTESMRDWLNQLESEIDNIDS